MISATLFWMGAGYFSEIIGQLLNETLIWYSVIVYSSSALIVKLLIRMNYKI